MSEAPDGSDEREPPHWWEPLIAQDRTTDGQPPEQTGGADPAAGEDPGSNHDAGPPADA